MRKVNEVRAFDAGQCVVEVHRRLSEWLRHGVTLKEIDDFVGKTLEDLKVRSCFLGYRIPGSPRFPSHACLSVNECVVHGTGSYYTDPLRSGDVLKIDIGLLRKGWIGDAARTYVFGEMSEEIRKLTDSGKEAMRRGVDQLRPGNRLVEWARAVQTCVEDDYKLHLVRGFGGHGYGRSLHTSPFISNVVPSSPKEWPDANCELKPGMLLAVEPMVAIGTGRVVQNGAEWWPVYIEDGSQSVHYEHDVLVTDEGPRLMTEGLDEVNDVILNGA